MLTGSTGTIPGTIETGSTTSGIGSISGVAIPGTVTTPGIKERVSVTIGSTIGGLIISRGTMPGTKEVTSTLGSKVGDR